MFKWYTGAVISTVVHKGFSGLIQQLEGRWDLHVALHHPNGRIDYKDGITNWSEAQSWIETEINNAVRGVDQNG